MATRWAAAVVVGAFLLSACTTTDLTGPSPSPTTGGEGSPSSSSSPPDVTPSTEGAPEAPGQLPRVISSTAELTELASGRYLNLTFDVSDGEFALLSSEAEPHSVTISHLDSGLVVASLKVDSDTRYYGNARFGDGWLYLVESPTLDRLDQTGPSLVHALDLETFTWSLVNPPSGTHWTQWPGTLLGDGSAHGTYGWVVDEEGRGCVAQIIATAAELGSCVADSVVMTSHSDSGLSALTVPPGGTVGDCRTRVTLAGLHAEPEVIGPECRTFDGLRHGDWEIWSEIPPDAHGRVELWRANLFASRSGETIELSTIMTTGTLTLCGDAVFWYERANEGPDGTIDSLVRWKPGEPSTVAVLVSEQDQALGALTCTNGLLSTFVISELGHGLTSVLVDPRVP